MARPMAVFVALVSLSATAAFAESRASRYCNERFGQCVDVPAGLAAAPAPVNGDGASFRGLDDDAFTMTVSARHNVRAETVAAAMVDATPPDATRIAYRRKATNWFVISGVAGDRVFYVKQFVTPKSISTLRIEYPALQADRYRALVNRLSRSFSPATR